MTLPGVWLNVSQMDGVRPSSWIAPSIWYEAVATPHRKSGGNVSRPASPATQVDLGAAHPFTAPSMIPPTIWRPSRMKTISTGTVPTSVAAMITEWSGT